jgi:hypothetical protein
MRKLVLGLVLLAPLAAASEPEIIDATDDQEAAVMPELVQSCYDIWTVNFTLDSEFVGFYLTPDSGATGCNLDPTTEPDFVIHFQQGENEYTERPDWVCSSRPPACYEGSWDLAILSDTEPGAAIEDVWVEAVWNRVDGESILMDRAPDTGGVTLYLPDNVTDPGDGNATESTDEDADKGAPAFAFIPAFLVLLAAAIARRSA